MDEETVGLWLWLIGIGVFVWFVWVDDSQWRYEMQYDGTVTVQTKPGDCDFLAAPLGRKSCHYEKRVIVQEFSRDTQSGRPVISSDARKTWQWNEGGPTTGTKVDVYWSKEAD